MKERPILFSTPMVQAVLKGEKTQTRRTRGLKTINENPNAWYFQSLFLHATGRFTFAPVDKYPVKDEDVVEVKYPYGQPGDLLWVRETFKKATFGGKEIFGYKSLEKYPSQIKYKPSIHMPKAAARIWLQVEEVKVERVQNISTEDMKAEGVRIPVSTEGKICFQIGVKDSAFSFLPDGYYADDADHGTLSEHEHTLYFAFWAELWCEVNGRASWDLNPWVWVVKFNVLSTSGKPDLSSIQNQKSSI